MLPIVPVGNLQARVDALFKKLDKRDPRLQEMSKLFDDTYTQAQRLKPYDTPFASSEACKAVLGYAERFPELGGLLPVNEDSGNILSNSPIAKPPEIVKPESVIIYPINVGHETVIVLPIPQVALTQAELNKPLTETIKPYLVLEGRERLKSGSDYVGLLKR